MSAPAPSAIGTLESTPFGELLVQALDHRLTGTLVLEETSGARHGIYLEGGKPKNVKLAQPAARLGDVLVDEGVISRELREQTLGRALERHVLYGQLLVGEGLISEQALGLGLKELVSRNLVTLFAQPLDTHYGYFEGTNFLAQWGAPLGTEPNLLEVLWRGLREHARMQEIDGALARMLGLKIKLRSDLPSDHFAFMGEDQELVALVAEHPGRVTELFERMPAREESIRRVLYFLVLTRSVDLGLPSAPPVGIETKGFLAPPAGRLPSFPSDRPASGPPAPPPSVEAPASSVPPVSVRRDSPPASIPPALVRSLGLREELRRLAQQPPQSHYEVLGIARDAAVAQVQSAFFLLSKHWHPDRLGAESADLREGATRVYESIAKAYRVLADPARRLAYDQELARGNVGGKSVVDRALAAELAFQKAESFLARGNIEAAEREAKVALSHDPKRAEHIALSAWLAALRPDADQRMIAANLARAVRLPDASAKVHYYRGLFLKRAGRHGAALQEFRNVCERDPRHIDAAREVRIYEQRLKSSPPDRPSLAPEAPSSQSSTWTRLFKRRS